MDDVAKRVSIYLALGIAFLALLVMFFVRANVAAEKLGQAVREAMRESSSKPPNHRRAPDRPCTRGGAVSRIFRVGSPRGRRGAPPPSQVDAVERPPVIWKPAMPSQLRGKVLQACLNPVARADVVLRRCSDDGRPTVLLARGRTDWEGTFHLDDVRPAREAVLEIEALYYLGYRSPSFSVGPGEVVELAPVILHFGASLQGEVREGALRGVPDAEVVFTSRNFKEGANPPSSRTDIRGTFLMSGLESAEYAFEVKTEEGALLSSGSLWVHADAPTRKVEIDVEGRRLTLSEDDPQQFHLYRAEKILSIGTTRFESLEEIREYVSEMIASSWWRSAFPEVRSIRVMKGRESDLARGGTDSVPDEAESSPEELMDGGIELPSWGWNELTVLHELAHVPSPQERHGRLFARNFHLLVSRMLGDLAASEMAQAFEAEGVRW